MKPENRKPKQKNNIENKMERVMGFETHVLLGKHRNIAKLLDKLTVTELARSSKRSKQYISQVTAQQAGRHYRERRNVATQPPSDSSRQQAGGHFAQRSKKRAEQPPSQKLIEALTEKIEVKRIDHLTPF